MSRLFKILVVLFYVGFCTKTNWIVCISSGKILKLKHVSNNKTVFKHSIDRQFMLTSSVDSKCASSNEISCKNNSTCVRANQLCDKIRDCPDNSDEENCEWCNQTFLNDGSNKISYIIQSPKILNYHASIPKCNYQIINKNKNQLIGIYFKKFSIGHFDFETKKCNKSWLEITESNSNEIPLFNEDHLQNLSNDDYNLTDFKSNTSMSGKYCGNLDDFVRKFYSDKTYVTISYFHMMSQLKRTKIDDSYEIEVKFYEKSSLDPLLFAKNTYGNKISHLNQGTLIENTACSYLYKDCKNKIYDGCLISSHNFPGFYLKNLKCQYHIKNEENERKEVRQNEKLILFNDILQVDGKFCEKNVNSSNLDGQNVSDSIYCDDGPRTNNPKCNDFISIFSGLNTYNLNEKSKSYSPMIKNICGNGNLAKIVAKSNSILIEFISGPDGFFSNMGFLFFAISQKKYFENYHQFNKFNENEVKSNFELNSIIALEKLHVEYCNSDQNNCIVPVNDNIIKQIYVSSTVSTRKSDQEILETTNNLTENVDMPIFKIGYLYGINQYHPNNFTLSYVLSSTVSNTIAIYLDKFEPSSSFMKSSSTNFLKCSKSYLKIETFNLLITNNENIPNDDLHKKIQDAPKHMLVKLCDQEDLINISNRNFLIKTEEKTLKKTHVLISYFSEEEALVNKFNLFNFKVNYEFVHFDWENYKLGSVCDFVYNFNLNSKTPLQGTLKNPESSIFYSYSDDYVKCRYRIIAKQNQYIRLDIKKIDFNMNTHENTYFHIKQPDSYKKNKCENLQKKILIKELNQPWIESDDHDVINDSFDTNYDYYDFVSPKENDDKKDFKTRICLCKLNKSIDYVYISKYDAIEIEYDVKLNKLDDLNKLNVNFEIKYEIMNRNCDKYVYQATQRNKGKLICDKANKYGIQKELYDMSNDYMDKLNVKNDSIGVSDFKNESEILKYLLIKNLNFHCKFNIEAPKNQFISIEFTEINMPDRCDQNYIKMYFNFSKNSIELNDFFLERPTSFIKLCAPTNIEKNNENRIVVAEFFDESIAKTSFSCIRSKNKICLMTSDLNNALNPLFKNTITSSNVFKDFNFINNFYIEIISDSLEDFYFEIKYNFYSIYLDDDILLNRESSSNLNISNKTDENKNLMMGKSIQYNCEFKCQPFNETHNNLTICLDDSLVCDNEIDCIYNNFDEINCPFKLTGKFIFTVLCGLFVLTVAVIFLFCLCRKHAHETIPINGLSEATQRKNIKYSKASSKTDQNYVA